MLLWIEILNHLKIKSLVKFLLHFGFDFPFQTSFLKKEKKPKPQSSHRPQKPTMG